MLPWYIPKIKQGIPATPNVPESLVFSGFPDILFISFVSNKRFTFQHRTGSSENRCALHNLSAWFSVC